jgi:hypothetical protein
MVKHARKKAVVVTRWLHGIMDRRLEASRLQTAQLFSLSCGRPDTEREKERIMREQGNKRIDMSSVPAANPAAGIFFERDLMELHELAVPKKHAILQKGSFAGQIFERFECFQGADDAGCRTDNGKDR